MKKWLLILLAVAAFSCGDGSRNNSGDENGGTGTTSSEGRDEGDMNEEENMNDDNDLNNNDRMQEQDTSAQVRTDTVGTSSSVSGPRRNKDGQDKSAKDY